MTLSLGRIIFITSLLTIFVIFGIFAMEVYANLHDIAQQYTTSTA